MTLLQIDVHSPMGELLELPLRGPSTFSVKSVEGLGLVAATIGTAQNANLDGLVETSSFLGGRDIRLRLGIVNRMGMDTPSKSRQRLFQILPTGQTVTLVLHHDDLPDMEISGKVETAEHNMFSANLEFVFNIRCLNPRFMVRTPKVLSKTTAIASLDENVTNEGSEIVGFELKVKAITNSIDSFQIDITNELGRVETLNYIGLIPVNAQVIIRTTPGNRACIFITAAGVETPLIQRITSTSAWPRLYPGVNRVRLTKSGAGSINPLTLTYNEAFGGV